MSLPYVHLHTHKHKHKHIKKESVFVCMVAHTYADTFLTYKYSLLYLTIHDICFAEIYIFSDTTGSRNHCQSGKKIIPFQ